MASWWHQLTSREQNGCVGGALGSGCAFMLLCNPGGMLGVGLAAGFFGIGGFAGTIGSNKCATNDGAFVSGLVKGGVVGTVAASAVNKITASGPAQRPEDDEKCGFHLDIHGPHPEPCPLCGRILYYHGEPHVCIPKGIV